MRIFLAIGILAIMAVFAGCAGKETPAPTQPTTTAAPTTAPPTTQPPTTAPVVLSGENVYNTKCAAACHPAGDPKVAGFPTAGKGTWADALNRMNSTYVVQKLTSEEFSAVEKYLEDNYPIGVPTGS